MTEGYLVYMDEDCPFNRFKCGKKTMDDVIDWLNDNVCGDVVTLSDQTLWVYKKYLEEGLIDEV